MGGHLVLGIDPGLARLGFGLVRQEGSTLLAAGGGTLSTLSSQSVPERLLEIFRHMERLIAESSPDVMALERVFLKVNAKTAIPSIQASGVAALAAASAGIEVHEYSPAQVKQALAGSGSAGKEQVRYMIEKILRPSYAIDSPDAADAHAVAVCHLNSRRLSEVINR